MDAACGLKSRRRGKFFKTLNIMQTILHGIARHNYFGILQPAYQRGGLDCSGIAMGIDFPHILEDPRTKEQTRAILIQRRTIYTDYPLFKAIVFLLYGAPAEEVMRHLKAKHPDMIDELVELWIFKKE